MRKILTRITVAVISIGAMVLFYFFFKIICSIIFGIVIALSLIDWIKQRTIFQERMKAEKERLLSEVEQEKNQ